MDLQRVVVSGRITHDVGSDKIKYLASGTAVLDLSIGSNSYKKGAGQYNQKSNFFNVTVFGKLAEVCANLHKGSRVLVDGRLDFQQWEKDGQKRSTVKIIADSVIFLDPKTQSQPAQTRPAPQAEPQAEQESMEFSDEPFPPIDDGTECPF